MMRCLFLLPALALTMDIPTKEIAPGVKMPVVSIGTGGQERSDAQEIVENWLSLGGRGIDGAQAYGNQGAVKAAIASSGVKREDLFITTKIPGCSNAQRNLDANLKSLGVDYVDLVLIHGPLGDCVSAWKTMEEFQKSGKTKAIGVSNFKKSNLQQILKVATVKPAINQIEHNVLEQHGDTAAAFSEQNGDTAALWSLSRIDPAFSEQNGIIVEAYSPLGRSGQSGDIPGNAVIKAVAASHSVSTYQVALKWILQHDRVLTFQSSSKAHQQSDADIFGFTLTDEEMSKLDQLGQSVLV